jgi:hypothetical protein
MEILVGNISRKEESGVGFIDLFTPRWKHSNAQVREVAVAKLTDRALLTELG